MGGKGVDARAKSVRVTFTFNGQQERRTLMLNGQPMLPTPANIKYAERLAAEIREKIRLDTFRLSDYFPVDGDTQDVTAVADQLDAWLLTQRIEHSTKAGYSSAIKFWKAAVYDTKGSKLGDKSLRALKHSEILTAIANRSDLSGKTINNYMAVLREALELAAKDGDIPSNPAAGVKAAAHQKAPPDPFSREEADRITADIAARYPPAVANLVEFWFWTGLRTSEIFGLRWANVDLSRRSILVTEALVRGKHKERTKTAVARTVELNSRALAALQRQKEHTLLAGGAVFQDPRYSADWIEERAFRRSFWEPCLKRLEIRYRRPYQMRHTYATAMLMAGMNPAWCAKQMGHSIEMFLRTYAKWIDGDQNMREMDKLEATLSPAYPQTEKRQK